MRAALDGNEIRTRTGLQQFDEDLLAGAGSVNLVHDKRISELGAPEFGTDERQPCLCSRDVALRDIAALRALESASGDGGYVRIGSAVASFSFPAPAKKLVVVEKGGLGERSVAPPQDRPHGD